MFKKLTALLSALCLCVVLLGSFGAAKNNPPITPFDNPYSEEALEKV